MNHKSSRQVGFFFFFFFWFLIVFFRCVWMCGPVSSWVHLIPYSACESVLMFKTQTHLIDEHISEQQDHKQTLLIARRNWSLAGVHSPSVVYKNIWKILELSLVKQSTDWVLCFVNTDALVSYELFTFWIEKPMDRPSGKYLQGWSESTRGQYFASWLVQNNSHFNLKSS